MPNIAFGWPKTWDWEVQDSVSSAIGAVGGLAAVLLFLSPMGVVAEIIRDKTTKHYSAFPYVVSGCNSAVLFSARRPEPLSGALVRRRRSAFADIAHSMRSLGGILFPHAAHAHHAIVHKLSWHSFGGSGHPATHGDVASRSSVLSAHHTRVCAQ